MWEGNSQKVYIYYTIYWLHGAIVHFIKRTIIYPCINMPILCFVRDFLWQCLLNINDMEHLIAEIPTQFLLKMSCLPTTNWFRFMQVILLMGHISPKQQICIWWLCSFKIQRSTPMQDEDHPQDICYNKDDVYFSLTKELNSGRRKDQKIFMTNYSS